MSQPYIGEIRMFGGNFAPLGWSFCEGQFLAISQNDALFNLIGTTYGGDGQSTFALPDLRGRFPMHVGPGFVLGQKDGTETVTLTLQQMPLHNHLAVCSPGGGSVPWAANSFWSTDPAGATAAYSASGGSPMAGNAIGNSVGNQPHDNMQPYLAVSFIISLFGVFPSQT
jgi:microcystin-dependent protein